MSIDLEKSTTNFNASLSFAEDKTLKAIYKGLEESKQQKIISNEAANKIFNETIKKIYHSK